MGKLILLFSLAIPLSADTIYWSSPTASAGRLGLDSVLSVNDAGMAVGYSGGQAAEVSIWAPSYVLSLGVPSYFSTAVDINDDGQIAGMYQDTNGHDYGFTWSASSGMIPLGTLGGSMSLPKAINANGQIVGQSTDSAGNLSAFLWTPGTGMAKIGDSASEIATAINVWGEIAYQEHPFPYWTTYAAAGNALSPSILNLGGQNSYIAAMNDSGWMVGTAGGQGFLWTTDGIVNLGASFTPVDINNRGEVLGSFKGRPVVWTVSGGFQYLDLGSYTSAYATAINDEGEIVGGGSAVPEPSGLVLFLAGATLMAAGWHRRPAVMVSRHPAPPAQPR